METCKNFLTSPLIHFSIAATSGACLLTAGVIVLATSGALLSGIYLLVAAAVAFIFLAIRLSFNKVTFYAELSQFRTNYCQFKLKNITPAQANFYLMGLKPCYYHVVDRSSNALLFQGAQPSYTFNHHKTLVDHHKIKTVINLTEEEENNDTIFSRPIKKDYWGSYGVSLHHSPIKDFTLPTVEHLKDLVSRVSKALTQGNVYLHCMSGIGRSSCVTLAWYINQYGWTLGKAKEILSQRRASANIDKEKMNQLIWDFIISGSKTTSYTLSDEIERRIKELSITNLEQKLSQIKNEYMGIIGLEETLKHFKIKNT
jgi:hypothetical protein